jgi:dipeptidyl aminopeptidase/acylaminoacyl peptidase
MKANGTGLERITDDPQGDYEPAWSPDGKRIAFTSTRADNYEIYIMDPSGMSLFRRTNSIQSDFSPDWQPLSPPDNDTTPPKVISTSPKPNATGVAPTVNLKVTFSKDMKASSVNAKTFKLFEEDSTTKIAAAVNYSAATDKATLNPTEALRKGATYKAVVTSGAKDAAGNPLDQNTAKPGLQQKPWVFTVDERTLPVLLTKPSHEVRDP